MSENWNAWNPNTEDDDLDALEAKKKQNEKEQEAKKWAELLFNKDPEPEEESASIFATVEKVDEPAEDEEADGREAEEDPDQTILEQPTFREDDPGEVALAQSESGNLSSDEDSPNGQEDVAVIEAAPETEDENTSEIVDTSDGEDSEEEKQQLEFAADQVDENQAEQESTQVESGEEDLDQESVLRIDRSEIMDEPAKEIEEETAPDETPDVDEAEISSVDSGAEVEDAESEGYRPLEGDQSEIISNEEAEELEAQLESTQDPDQTILEQPTFREDDPGEVESAQKTKAMEEEQALNAEAEEEAEAAAAAASVVAGARYVGGRRVKKVVKHEKETIEAEHEDEQDYKDNDVESQSETIVEESSDELADDNEPDQELETAENEEDALKAVAYIYAANEALKGSPESDMETDEEEKTAVVSNQELSSQTHEDIEGGSTEEVDAERLVDHPEMQPYDPEAESFDKRQETISQGPPKDESDYYGDAQSSQDVTPISDILADKEQHIANINANSEDRSQIDPNAQSQNINVRGYRSAIVTGIIAGIIIIVLSILYLIFR